MPLSTSNSDDISTAPPHEYGDLDSPGLHALSILYDRIKNCARCDLSKGRTQVVFGTGNSEFPDIAFVGEIPSKEEDAQGFPFLGAGGALLDKAIVAMGYQRQDVYLTNVVSCVANRSPHAEEVSACRPVWGSQLVAVQPKVIVVLGQLAGNAVLEKSLDMRELRGRWWEWRGFPVRVTYAPAYVARTESAKPLLWEDLQQVMGKLAQQKAGVL